MLSNQEFWPPTTAVGVRRAHARSQLRVLMPIGSITCFVHRTCRWKLQLWSFDAPSAIFVPARSCSCSIAVCFFLVSQQES